MNAIRPLLKRSGKPSTISAASTWSILNRMYPSPLSFGRLRTTIALFQVEVQNTNSQIGPLTTCSIVYLL